MSEQFDAYYQWLGIPPKDQPPNHYRLLAIELFEENRDVIATAADRQMGFIKSYQTGPPENQEASQRILNELSTARLCLLNPEKKTAYDKELRSKLEKDAGTTPRPAARWTAKPSTPPEPDTTPAGKKEMPRSLPMSGPAPAPAVPAEPTHVEPKKPVATDSNAPDTSAAAIPVAVLIPSTPENVKPLATEPDDEDSSESRLIPISVAVGIVSLLLAIAIIALLVTPLANNADSADSQPTARAESTATPAIAANAETKGSTRSESHRTATDAIDGDEVIPDSMAAFGATPPTEPNRFASDSESEPNLTEIMVSDELPAIPSVPAESNELSDASESRPTTIEAGEDVLPDVDETMPAAPARINTATVTKVDNVRASTYKASATDLVNAGQSTLKGVQIVAGKLVPNSSLAKLNDGDLYGGKEDVDSSETFIPKDGTVVLFNLNTEWFPQGFDLHSVVSFTGSAGRTQLRSRQHYTVEICPVAAQEFLPLFTVENLGSLGQEVRVTTTTEKNDPLARGIGRVRVTFHDTDSESIESMYREIDIFGEPTR